MFKEFELGEAMKKLFSLYGEEDYEAYDEEEYGDVAWLCASEVAQAIRDKMQDVYEYCVDTNLERGFKYCGKNLFGQRACCIISEMDMGISDFATTEYRTELWVLEDMTFATVHCVDMRFCCGEDFYNTEYRSMVQPVEFSDDLSFPPEDVREALEEMCIPQWEGEATIYEL